MIGNDLGVLSPIGATKEHVALARREISKQVTETQKSQSWGWALFRELGAWKSLSEDHCSQPVLPENVLGEG